MDVSPSICVVVGCIDARFASYSATVSESVVFSSSSLSSESLLNVFVVVFDFRSVNELAGVILRPPNNGRLMHNNQ